MLNYCDLEAKFGGIIAYQCLTEIEIAAHINPREMTGIDPETRLANALRAQDEVMGESEMLMAA